MVAKPQDIANYFNDFFINKVRVLRQNMNNTDFNTFEHKKWHNA